jgi:polyhydroxybutyrate depolymerase
MKNMLLSFLIGFLLITCSFSLTFNLTAKSSFNQNENNISNIFKLGESELKMMIAGSSFRFIRFYRIYIPESYDNTNSVPLVLVFHGSASIGNRYNLRGVINFYQDNFFEEYTKFNEKAEEEGFIVVYPKSLVSSVTLINQYLFTFIPPHYPDSWFKNKDNVDDIGFIDDLISKLHEDYNIDSNKIYLTGMSNGADFIHYYASVNSDKIASIATVSGEAGKKELSSENYVYPPEPDNPVSVIMFHGTKDIVYPYDGDEWGCGVNHSIQFWIENNNCDTIPIINESGSIAEYIYSNGLDGSEVILYKTVGGDHWWPGNGFNDIPDASWLIDTIQEIDATDLIWDFFKSHPKL